MRKIDADRNRRIREALSAVFIVLLLILIVALIAYARLDVEQVFSSPYVFAGSFLSFVFIALLLYLTERDDPFLRKSTGLTFRLRDLLYIGVPLLLAAAVVFLAGEAAGGLKAILVVPVLMAAIVRGQRSALFTAVLAGVLLLAPHLTAFNPDLLTADLLLLLVIFALGWTVGGITDAEVTYAAELEKLADRDDLTGLYNHRAFQEQLQTNFEQAAAAQEPLTLVVGDIDYFKYYNNCYGHHQGDQVLTAIGALIADRVADRGIVARYGGEEFAVIMPNRTPQEGRQLAEELRVMVGTAPLPGGGTQPLGRITMSFGVASFPGHAQELRELLTHADHALFRAKFATKNRVEVYTSVLETLFRRLSQDERDALNSIRTLVMVVNAKDHYTFGHSERVADTAVRLAARLGLSDAATRRLTHGAYLHDIGKVEIDRALLNKRDVLSDGDWQTIKQHPLWGSQLVEPISFLQDLAPVVRYHHENYDGSGYPESLWGEKIPIDARIVRVVDSFDAMITQRPYGTKRTPEEACREILAKAGTFYDPEIARTFVKMIRDEGSVYPSHDAPLLPLSPLDDPYAVTGFDFPHSRGILAGVVPKTTRKQTPDWDQ